MLNTKTLLCLVVFIISMNLFSQNLTYIPGPVGYGTNTTADDRTLIPFFQDQSYIYCTTYEAVSTNPIIKRACIVRVNTSDGSQFIYTDFYFSDNPGVNAKKKNNTIYFNIGSELAAINTITNKLTIVSYNAQKYEICDNYIVYETSSGSGLCILNLKTKAITQVSSPKNSKLYGFGSHYYDKDKGIFYFRSQISGNSVYYAFYKYIFSTKSITEIVGKNVLSGTDMYQDRDEMVKVNDNLVFLMKDTDYNLKYFSMNLTTQLLNTAFTFNTKTVYNNALNDLMVFNNTVYITSGDKVFISDGTATPKETDYQPFFQYYTGYSIDIVYFNNEAYIQQYSSENGTELWKYNGTLNQRQLVKDITPGTQSSFAENIMGGYLHKNKLLYIVNVGPLSYSLYTTDGTSDGTICLLDKSQFSSISKLLTDDDTLYFYGVNAKQKGLFALNYDILSNNDFSKNEKVNFYPNPVKTDVNFLEKMSEVKIMDLNGKILILEQNVSKLTLEHLTKGIYLIELNSQNQGKSIQKIIKI